MASSTASLMVSALNEVTNGIAAAAAAVAVAVAYAPPFLVHCTEKKKTMNMNNLPWEKEFSLTIKECEAEFLYIMMGKEDALDEENEEFRHYRSAYIIDLVKYLNVDFHDLYKTKFSINTVSCVGHVLNIDERDSQPMEKVVV